MRHGLIGKDTFRELTTHERAIAERLAEIEREDEERCRNCGGEDCICCELYIDRQKWVSPEELFGWDGDPYDLNPAYYDGRIDYGEDW